MLCARVFVTVVAAGLMAPLASGGVVDVSIEYEGGVADLVDFNTGEVIGNESFSGMGGLGLLPIHESGIGGDGLTSAQIALDTTGSLGGGGALTISQLLSADVDGYSDFFNAVQDARVSSTLSFSVSGAREFTLLVDNAFFDNDLGTAGLALSRVGFGVVAELDFLAPFPQEFGGVLEGGDYELHVFAFGDAGVSYTLDVAAPAPSGVAPIALAGLVGARRRRR